MQGLHQLRQWLGVALLLAAVGGAFSGTASADTLNLSGLTSAGTVAPGGELIFSGTLTAPATNTYTLSLDTYSLGLDANFTPDDNIFYGIDTGQNPSYTLASGTAYTGQVFGFTVDSNTPAGMYNGLFAISGAELDSNGNSVANTSYNSNPDTGRFIFIVAPTPAPEPASFIPLGLGALLLTSLVLRSRRGLRAADVSQGNPRAYC